MFAITWAKNGAPENPVEIFKDFSGLFYFWKVILNKTITVYFIRHGETIAQTRGLFSGKSDLPLTENGRKQASALSLRSDLSEIRTCISSPLSRCRETASIVFRGSRVVFDEDLAEIDFGDWEMKTWQEISEKYPEKAEKWSRQEDDFCFPQGESVKAFFERIKRVAGKIVEYALSDENHTIAVFAHGGVIKSLICRWLGIPPEKHFHFAADIASVSCMNISEGFGYLLFLNDTSHLQTVYSKDRGKYSNG